MKWALYAVFLKILKNIFGEKVAEAVKAFFGFLESLGINSDMFLIFVTIVIIGVLVYIVVDFIQLRRKPARK